jgi:hypothetical protein
MNGRISVSKGKLAITYLDGSHFTMGILKIREKELVWIISVWIGNKNSGYISWAQNFQSKDWNTQFVSNNGLNGLILWRNTKNQLEIIGFKNFTKRIGRQKNLSEMADLEDFNQIGTAQ